MAIVVRQELDDNLRYGESALSQMRNYMTEKNIKQILPRFQDNFIYFYHTGACVLLPVYPAQINDSTQISYTQQPIMGRSAPIYSYSNSGPRSFSIELNMHREMLKQVYGFDATTGADYMEFLINNLQTAAVPVYGNSAKLIDPPMVMIRIGEDIRCKGIITGSVSVTYGLPILKTGKYATVNISFSVTEIDPYDSLQIQKIGSFRGSDIVMNTSLDSGVYRVPVQSKNSSKIINNWGF